MRLYDTYDYVIIGSGSAGSAIANRLGEDYRLRILVQDTGLGIPPDKLESVFEAFTQVDTSTTRKVGGTGLGLVICKGIVEQHGGEVGVETEPGKGSSFWFTLPVETPSGSVDLIAPPAANTSSQNPMTSRVSTRPLSRCASRPILPPWRTSMRQPACAPISSSNCFCVVFSGRIWFSE